MTLSRTLNVIVVIVVLTSAAFADCAVLSPNEAERVFAYAARNIFLKGIFLGVSFAVLIANLLLLLVRNSAWLLCFLFLLAIIPILVVYFFAETMAYCGHAGISAVYYLLPMFGLILLFVVQFFWNQQPKRLR